MPGAAGRRVTVSLVTASTDPCCSGEPGMGAGRRRRMSVAGCQTLITDGRNIMRATI